MNHDDQKLELAIAEAEARRWRNVAIRLLAFTANLAEIRGAGVVARELDHGWFCLDCGWSGESPEPPVCPGCGAGEDQRAGPTRGHAAALLAREIVRGHVPPPPPQAGVTLGESMAPEGRQRIEIAIYCPKCRGLCPPSATKPEDCPSCHGQGI